MTHAGQVTKVLLANGFIKTEWLRAGVSITRDGFLSSNDPLKSVSVVTWELKNTYEPNAEQLVAMNEKLDAMLSVLVSAGYQVVKRSFVSYAPYLEVSK
jgi:hypothetical protein